MGNAEREADARRAAEEMTPDEVHVATLLAFWKEAAEGNARMANQKDDVIGGLRQELEIARRERDEVRMQLGNTILSKPIADIRHVLGAGVNQPALARAKEVMERLADAEARLRAQSEKKLTTAYTIMAPGQA